MTDNDLIAWLERWYLAHCNGEWEHAYGLEIDTLDNPGWRLRLHVGDEIRTFDRVRWEDGQEWMQAWLEDSHLNVACGPTSLRRALMLLRETLET